MLLGDSLRYVNRARAAGAVRVEAALPSDEAHPLSGVALFLPRLRIEGYTLMAGWVA